MVQASGGVSIATSFFALTNS